MKGKWKQRILSCCLAVFIACSNGTPANVFAAVWDSKKTIIEETKVETQETSIQETSVQETTGEESTQPDIMLGDGTAENPYQITNAEQLKKMSEHLDAYYELTQDIDLQGELWTPLGVKSIPFKGSMNGNGYTLSNFTIQSTVNNTGFLGYAKNAVVTNLNINGVTVTGKSNVGAIAGYITGSTAKIQGCHVIQSTISGTNYVGGLIGSNGSAMIEVVKDCSVDGEIHASSGYAGGIAGSFYGKMEQCMFQGTIDSAGWETGGIAGAAQKATIQKCYAKGQIIGAGEVGGIVGWAVTVPVSIEDCFSLGTVKATGNTYAGGILGNSSRLENSIKRCYSIAKIESTGERYGITGGLCTVFDTYYDMEANTVENQDSMDTNRVTAAMISKSNYANWDFDTVWSMEEGEGYPYLQCLNKPDGLEVQISENSGIGTSEEPFLIKDADDLEKLRIQPNAWYRLENDIDLSGVLWTPVGTSTNPFSGYILGNEHTISNITVNTGKNYASFLGVVSHAEVSDLTLSNVSITGKNSVGALAGYVSDSNSVLKNCSVTQAQVRGASYTGGIAGKFTGKMEQCFYKGEVSSDSWEVGGLIGESSNTTMNQCYFDGEVSGSGEVGGLIGLENGTTDINNSFSTGHVTSTENTFSGGILGNGNDGGATITNCLSVACVESQGEAYGITGANATITNSYYDAEFMRLENTSANDIERLTGALCSAQNYKGWNMSYVWTIEEGESYPYLKQLDPPERIAPVSQSIQGNGSLESPFIISTKEQMKLMKYQLTGNYELAANIDMEGETWVPLGNTIHPFCGKLNGNGYEVSNLVLSGDKDYTGFFGIAKNSEVNKFHLKQASISGKNYVGGIAGKFDGTISKCSFQGNVTAEGNYAGGLTGCLEQGDIDQSYTTATVKGNDYVGGITGISTEGAVAMKNSYAAGIIEGNNYIGGFFGHATLENPVEHCYAACQLKGKEHVGGFEGDNQNLSITDSYYDLRISGRLKDSTGYGKITSDLSSQNTFSQWDFEQIWKIDSGASYPYLVEKEPIPQVSIGKIKGHTINARTSASISGIKIVIREGENNKDGIPLADYQSDAQGYYTIDYVPYGTYTLEISDEKYVTEYVTVVCNKETVDLGNNTIVPVLGANKMSIVLTWGANPRDLDSHFSGPSTHVYYSSRSGRGVSLDTDQTGGYGPETITLDFESMYEGVYQYYVNWYSGSGTWATSNAKVTVYMDNKKVAEYTAADKSGSGGTWYVFKVDTATRSIVNE